MITGRLISSLAVAFVIVHAGWGSAPRANAAPPFASDGTGPRAGNPRSTNACISGFTPLRDEAERRGKQVKAAANRKAPKEEACRLVTRYAEAEARLLDYVEANARRCVIPRHDVDQIRTGRKRTQALLLKVCDAPLVSDAGDTAKADPVVVRPSSAIQRHRRPGHREAVHAVLETTGAERPAANRAVAFVNVSERGGF